MKPFDEYTQTYERVHLDVMRQAVRKHLELGLFDHVNPEGLKLNKIDLALTTTAKHMIFELEHYIAAQKLENLVVHHPETWWEHFKQDVLSKYKWGRRYVRKHPVKYKEKRFDVRVFYPDIKLPKERNYIEVMKMS